MRFQRTGENDTAKHQHIEIWKIWNNQAQSQHIKKLKGKAVKNIVPHDELCTGDNPENIFENSSRLQ